MCIRDSYKYGPLKNTETELDNQSEVLVRALTHEIEKRNFIVLGYSGRDNSVMDALESCLLYTSTDSRMEPLSWEPRHTDTGRMRMETLS